MKKGTEPAAASLLTQLKNGIESRDREATNRSVDALVRVRAPLGREWQRVAELMRMSGEVGLAHRAMDRFVSDMGGTAQARYAKVVLCTQTNRQREALDLLAKLPETVPTPAGHAYVRGNIAMMLGRTEEAEALLLRALDLQPGWGPAWLTLANSSTLLKGPIGDRLLDEKAIADRQPSGDRARYYYALGRMHDARREHRQSFEAFSQGAALLKSERPYSRAGNEANARQAMIGYSPEMLARLRDMRARDTGRPIFVTGLPRSGTTLVEHIVASHSTVDDGGELNLAPHLAVAVGGVSGTALEDYVARHGSVDPLSGLYLHLLSERFDTSGRIVDKTVDASRFLGLIAGALPDAPVVWMHRDPLDDAWSCFRTFFIHGVAWSYDLRDIAHHFRLEDDLRRFWQDLLGDRLLVVPYAELVDGPEQWTRRILAHCGLPEEVGVHQAHESDRVVTTASSLQVRRPINRDGLNVAQPYRDFLRPFVEAYSD